MPNPSVPSIGVPPWTAQEIAASIEEFLTVYEKRPFENNREGMGAPHLFATWFMVRHLKPEIIVESGVWKGMGTWFLERASPESKLISIDPNPAKRIYTSPKATYYSIDFSEIDWSPFDLSRALVFFDDHQNAYSRLILCCWFGFSHVIFEDNNPGGRGDFYTLRHAFEGVGFGSHLAEDKAREYTSFKRRLIRFLKGRLLRFNQSQDTVIPQYSRDFVAPNSFDARFLRRNLRTYYEFPPVFASPGDTRTSPPLFSDDERERYPAFDAERDRYNQICYVELLPPPGESSL